MNGNFYNAPNYGNGFFDQFHAERLNQKRSIKSHSIKVGICILIFLSAPYIAGFILAFTDLFSLYEENFNFQYSVELMMNVLFLFVPFFILYKISDPKNAERISSSFEKPASRQLTVSAVFFGLMLCFAGDYIASVIDSVFQSVGITLTQSEPFEIPDTPGGYFIFAFAIIVPPAIIEEFALRAVTMQPLRKYGEVFAIVSTAAVFGLMHRNAVQGIFAFIAGIVFGYIAVSTNSVWTSVIIHALNNAFSVLMNILNDKSPQTANLVYVIIVATVFLAGILFSVPFFRNPQRVSLAKKNEILTTSEKTKAFFLTVPMLISIIILIIYSVFGD